MITYQLSLNPSMLVKVLLIIKQIYNLLKMNLFLFIRKIELYYGDDFCRKNDIYFKTCNYFLNENGLDNLYENEIVNIINKNCVSMVKDLGNILNYYESINNSYYNDFKNIYLNLSRIDEKDINEYFYKYLFNSSKENMIIQQRINNYSIDNIENSNYIETNDNFYNNNNYNNYLITNQNQALNQEQEDDEAFLDSIILSYKKNKEIPPFLKYKNPKKYTLVLDLEDTLISVKVINEGKILIRPRPGLISFLTGVKQYYEIISFSKLSKNYSSTIIEQIEENRKLFDFNLYREHCTLVGRKFVKDISNIGRDMKKIIMIDDLPENLNIHIENGILILPYDGDENKEDRVLYELKKLLILFYNLGYEDLRNAIKSYKNEIYQKITLGLAE
jgi:CTD small phosphatase-like protein 2